MCLYPRLIDNRKYRANKKNGGKIPPIKDQRTRYVPVGCQTCIECRKQKAREWLVRIQEDIKTHTNGKFVTLTFSTESLKKLTRTEYKILKHSKIKHVQPPYAKPKIKHRRAKRDLTQVKGYDLDNAIVIKAIRLFLERWRKKYGKSLRHWLVTELGHGRTEHIHLHGIVWTDYPQSLEEVWQYGTVWRGYKKTGHGNTEEYENYVTPRTVNYMTKYITKIDLQHLNYKPMILASPGIGSNYTKTTQFLKNNFNYGNTNETYRTSTGHKMAIPIYWRNKRYTDEQRELLWIQKLDKGERFVCGERVKADDEKTYYNLLEYHRKRTSQLGYPTPDFIWSKKKYEQARRELIHGERLWDRGQ